ncbi:hypothetical protein Y1Q_0015159 [Alligator mississippiensis]|uniref:Uncharacterized protein n=1 Tax=Alligator mississippiensis TaxID=8496 RepID=A0A151P8Z2_ALLMI|nr:hypothetical protein Y1Q_0015159 [Alligator mississippiensis]
MWEGPCNKSLLTPAATLFLGEDVSTASQPLPPAPFYLLTPPLGANLPSLDSTCFPVMAWAELHWKQLGSQSSISSCLSCCSSSVA